jgi:hypothetical protein
VCSSGDSSDAGTLDAVPPPPPLRATRRSGRIPRARRFVGRATLVGALAGAATAAGVVTVLALSILLALRPRGGPMAGSEVGTAFVGVTLLGLVGGAIGGALIGLVLLQLRSRGPDRIVRLIAAASAALVGFVTPAVGLAPVLARIATPITSLAVLYLVAAGVAAMLAWWLSPRLWAPPRAVTGSVVPAGVSDRARRSDRHRGRSRSPKGAAGGEAPPLGPPGRVGSADAPDASSAPPSRRDPPMETFPFAFDAAYRLPLKLVGVTPARCGVSLYEDHLDARFGRFRVRTSWENVVDATVTGPYRAYRAIGPRFSLSDHGVTFGSTSAGGVCISFAEPVRVLLGNVVRHPSLTVTVADPAGLVAAIDRARGAVEA